jgi:hypothetical protein
MAPFLGENPTPAGDGPPETAASVPERAQERFPGAGGVGAPLDRWRPYGAPWRLPWCPQHDGGLERRCTCDTLGPPDVHVAGSPLVDPYPARRPARAGSVVGLPARGAPASAVLDPLRPFAPYAGTRAGVFESAGESIAEVYAPGPRPRAGRGDWARAFRGSQVFYAARQRAERRERRGGL